jgi:predicted nucleotide-binding protein (sugar kinase/HSP70/actin superfamily)
MPRGRRGRAGAAAVQHDSRMEKLERKAKGAGKTFSLELDRRHSARAICLTPFGCMLEEYCCRVM